MVLLKEPNTKEFGWKYQDFILRQGYLEEKSSTWPNLIRWTYGILNNFPSYQEVEQDFDYIKQNSINYFGSVCFANIKKVAGSSASNDNEIIQFSEVSHPLILKQISILEPNIVLCCGNIVFDTVRKSLEKEKIHYERKFTSGGLERLWWNIRWLTSQRKYLIHIW